MSSKVTKKENQKKRKFVYIIIPLIILVCIIGMGMQPPAIETLDINENAQTFDVNQEKTLSYSFTPEDADTSNLTAEVSNTNLAKVNISEDGKLLLTTLDEEGEFDVVLYDGETSSNSVTFTIVDSVKEAERIAAKKKAEEERIAAEKKAEEERIAAEKAEQERIASEKAAQAQQQSQSSNSKTVYVTPTGKRYHYDSSCGRGTYSPTTLDNAISMGLTPCQKCTR